MTVATMFLGLVPIMWSTGTGADVMKRIAAPMIGGIFTSFLLELVVYPAIYEVWKWDLTAGGLKKIRRADDRLVSSALLELPPGRPQTSDGLPHSLVGENRQIVRLP